MFPWPGRKLVASEFNVTHIYVDDVLSIEIPTFEDRLQEIYRPELEIKETAESDISAFHWDALMSFEVNIT